MKLIVTLCLIALLARAWPAHAQGFGWSWEESKQPAGQKPEGAPAAATAVAPEAAADAKPAAPATDAAFGWTWEKSESPETPEAGKPAVSRPDQPESVLAPAPAPLPAAVLPPPEGGARAVGGIDSEAYNELLKENLALRRRSAESTQQLDDVKRENQRLTAEMKDLERRLTEFASLVQSLRSDREKGVVPDDPDRTVQLETQRAAAEREKAAMAEEVASLQKRIADLKAGQAPVMAGGDRTVRPGSDLFRKVEEENRLLKEGLVRAETEKQQAIQLAAELAEKAKKIDSRVMRVADKEQVLKEEVSEARAAEQQYKRTLSQVLRQIPTMEEKLGDMQSDLSQKQEAIVAREREMEMLALELQKREHRLIKAERMTAVMAQAREEVRQVGDKEKRDMHYNMAAVYAKEGRFREAEQEYLHALRVDPNDAAVHYNLGILYDDELKAPRQAAMHYRKYLKLSPYADDVDQVKQWLMRVEVNQ